MVSETRLLDFFVQNLRLPEGEAREAVREFKAAEAELHNGVDDKVDRKFEERKDTLATKEDLRLIDQRISALEVRMEQNTNKIVFWLVGVVFASAGLVVALVKLMD